MTRAVFLDVDGVLVHGYHARPELQQRWDETLLADLGVDPDRFRAEFIYDVFIKKVVIGEMSLIHALERRLPSMGYKGSPMVFAHYWMTHDTKLNHPLLTLVKQLKQRQDLTLYVATNQEHMRADYLMQKVGLGEHVDGIIYSAAVGHRKPAAEFFDHAAAIAGAEPADIVLVDDTLANVEGARKRGWNAVHWTGEQPLAEALAPYLD